VKKAWLHKQDGEESIRFVFPNDFGNYELYKKICAIPNIKGRHKENYWFCPVNTEIIKDLISWEFIVTNELKNLVTFTEVKKEQIVKHKIKDLKGNLFEFQKEGVAFIEEKKGRVLLADQMGLGKTIQCLAWINMHPELRPVVIITPASLKLDWLGKINDWLYDAETEIIRGTKPYTLTKDLIIINYDILYAWILEIRKINPKLIIADEIHYIKESTAKRTKAFKRIVRGIDHFIAVSGTPMLNRPAELYNAIKIINPNLFETPKSFQKRYCGLRYNGFGWDYSGASHLGELNYILQKTIMIRRLKKDVLKDLPDKLYSFVPIELDNEKEYKEAEENVVKWLQKEKGDEAALRAKNAETFAKFTELKKLSVKGKLTQSIEWISDFLLSGDKLVVFAHHHFVIDTIMDKFKDIAVKIDGRDSDLQKEKAKNTFQNDDKIKLFVGGIKAANVGLTLTAASSVALLEYPWSPGDVEQCADRCHRIGQKDNVTIYYLHGLNSIELHIAKLLDRKKNVLDMALDGKKSDQELLITELIKIYSEEKLI